MACSGGGVPAARQASEIKVAGEHPVGATLAESGNEILQLVSHK